MCSQNAQPHFTLLLRFPLRPLPLPHRCLLPTSLLVCCIITLFTGLLSQLILASPTAGNQSSAGPAASIRPDLTWLSGLIPALHAVPLPSRRPARSGLTDHGRSHPSNLFSSLSCQWMSYAQETAQREGGREEREREGGREERSE